jgi:hypothetical protein
MTKVPTGLAVYPDATLTAALEWTPSKTTWTNYIKDVSPAFFSKVDIAIAGQSDAQKEPAKTMNAWWTTNQQKIKDAGFTGDQLKVSSWAMIVDITFAQTAPKFYSAVQTGTSVEGKNTAPFVFGKGCTVNAQAAGTYCLPEDANSNSLVGVCKAWGAMCTLQAGCTAIANCVSNGGGGGVAANMCSLATAFT